jgi:5-methylthioadenosine/S-adenosylhomocysteine deaminase
MRHDHPMKPATPDACCCGPDVSSAPAPSRRALLTASAGLAAGAAALPLLSDSARAQAAGANADGLLARVQGQRRILLKGGVVLTLDRGIGDFAQADVLIENGKIREVRPSVAISSDDAAVIDATNRLVVPGFIDTHHHFYQGLLRSILTNGLLNPDYSRDIGNTLTPAYAPADAYAGVLVTALA